MKTIFETKEGLKLFQNGLSLYEKTERKNTRSASVNGIEVGYLEFGSRDGIPLIWATWAQQTRDGPGLKPKSASGVDPGPTHRRPPQQASQQKPGRSRK